LLFFLDQERRGRERTDHWFPLLQTFTAECRRHRPAPERTLFSRAQYAEYRIIRHHTETYLTGKNGNSLFIPHRPLIVSTTPVGLLVMDELFATRRECLLILCVDEFRLWLERIQDDPYEWWYTSFDCELTDQLDVEDHQAAQAYPLPANGRYLIVNVGSGVGALSASYVRHLWTWDGRRRAQYCGEIMWMDS
jgi:hypothetical protein